MSDLGSIANIFQNRHSSSSYNQTVDFFLSPTRDTQAAFAFFKQAIGNSGQPEKINMDKSGANLAGLEKINLELPVDCKVTIIQVKYLNNLIGQDHRGIKRIVNTMLGFKNFFCAAATLARIELYHMIRKGQNAVNGTLPTWKQFYALAG